MFGGSWGSWVRFLAIVRSKIEKIPVILSSATPSVETFNNLQKKNYGYVYLSKQYSGYQLPRINLIDMLLSPGTIIFLLNFLIFSFI